jgi:DNA-binding transcriptional ArsR family regulator
MAAGAQRAGTERGRRGATAAPVVRRPMVRDVSGRGARVELSFERRTAYDFIVSLYVAAGEDSDLLPEDGAWLERALKALPESIRTDLADNFGETSKGIFHSLPSLIVDRPEVADATSLVQAVNDLDEHELSLTLVESMLDDMTHRADQLLAGDKQALAEARRTLDERHCDSLEGFLEHRPQRIGALRRVLDAWLPVYREIEPRAAEMLERDIVLRKNMPHGEDVVDLVEATTGGVRWFPEANVRRVIMAPVYFGRPYNYVYQGGDWRLFLYPLAEEALGPADEGVPSEAVVRLYRALGDVTRMRVLRLLSERDWYLTELAQHLELSKPTMKHHLALLRAAGLVTVTDEGSMTYYSLRRERIKEAGLELERFLG